MRHRDPSVATARGHHAPDPRPADSRRGRLTHPREPNRLRRSSPFGSLPPEFPGKTPPQPASSQLRCSGIIPLVRVAQLVDVHKRISGAVGSAAEGALRRIGAKVERQIDPRTTVP